MQKRGITLCVLMGMLWLLGGCVAPDGSVIQFQQAPDGTIVGWQVDAPAEAVVIAEAGTPFLPRPILYMDNLNGGFSIYAIDPDGPPSLQ